LFIKLKEPEVVRPGHLTPAEWLPEARSVISYFLSLSQKVREANYSDGLPALEWVYGRWEGEECNNGVKKLLIDLLEKSGETAVAPL
jgi:epoxyqueuosine reductase QueG